MTNSLLQMRKHFDVLITFYILHLAHSTGKVSLIRATPNHTH